jgi:hypothetical protein
MCTGASAMYKYGKIVYRCNIGDFSTIPVAVSGPVFLSGREQESGMGRTFSFKTQGRRLKDLRLGFWFEVYDLGS